MKNKTYEKLRIAIAIFTSVIIGMAVVQDNTILAIAGILTGLAFMTIVRSKAKIQIDEREKMVREKAALTAYAIFAPTIGLGSVFLVLLAPENSYLMKAIGFVLAYLSLFLIALYSICTFYFNRKFGGDGQE
jgi:uncharacterized membrane protein